VRSFFLSLLLPLAVFSEEKICVIINPLSGGVKKHEIALKILEQLKSYDVELVYTNGPLHATTLAKEAVGRGAQIVAIVGGDGSVNEACQSLVGTETALAIIPTGSGNGLAHHLNIPLEIEKAIHVIKEGHTEKIDTIKVNNQYYLCVAGVGFDAEVGWAFSEFGHRGFLSYLLMTLKKLPTYQPRNYNLCIDGKKVSKEAFLIAFANSSQFGNDAYIAPTAEINDGYLDVIIMKRVPFYATAKVVHQLFNRSLDNSRYVEIIKCKEIDVTEQNLKAHVDGEPMVFPEGMHFQVVPSSLKVVVPKK
jgi:YegS/Rv2252/BmrU family lipid kinase